MDDFNEIECGEEICPNDPIEICDEQKCCEEETRDYDEPGNGGFTVVEGSGVSGKKVRKDSEDGVVMAAQQWSDVNGCIVLYTIVALLLIGWLPTLCSSPHMGVIKIPGFQGSGILLMLATYCIGHLIRHSSLDAMGSCWIWFLAFIAAIALLSCDKLGILSSNGYTSPFVILTAVLGFVTFLHMPSSMGRFGEVVNFLSPSMFGVYVLHECCLKKYQYFQGGGVCNAILLFILCVGIDLVRRLLVRRLQAFLLLV